jgi:hypothetical protein
MSKTIVAVFGDSTSPSTTFCRVALFPEPWPPAIRTPFLRSSCVSDQRTLGGAMPMSTSGSTRPAGRRSRGGDAAVAI